MLRVALIGCGGIGDRRANALASLQSYRLAVVSDVVFGEMDRVAPETHGLSCHDRVLRRPCEGSFEIDSDVFGESTDSVAARGTDVAELQAGCPA